MIISLIVAMDEEHGIGKDNRLLWHLPNDLKWFKEHTFGKPIIMGRKTYDSIGRALPGRANIVVTRQADFSAPNVTVVSSLEEAFRIASDSPKLCDECAVIGGAEIYALALPHVSTMYVTRVHTKAGATVFFPDFDFSEWNCVVEEKHTHDAKHLFDYTFCVYQRRP